MCASSKNISDGAARLGTSLFTNGSGIHWGTGPIYHPYCPVLRHTLAHRQLSLDSDTLFNQRCYLKGAFKGCVPHQRPRQVYIARSVTDVDHKPRMQLNQPQRWIPHHVTSASWAIIGNEAAFTAPAKLLTKYANIYWTTWHTEPELPWQVRLIHKLNSN